MNDQPEAPKTKDEAIAAAVCFQQDRHFSHADDVSKSLASLLPFAQFAAALARMIASPSRRTVDTGFAEETVVATDDARSSTEVADSEQALLTQISSLAATVPRDEIVEALVWVLARAALSAPTLARDAASGKLNHDELLSALRKVIRDLRASHGDGAVIALPRFIQSVVRTFVRRELSSELLPDALTRAAAALRQQPDVLDYLLRADGSGSSTKKSTGAAPARNAKPAPVAMQQTG